MPDVHHDFPVAAPLADVFRAVATAEGLNAWWTERATGVPGRGVEWKLVFGPEHEWRGVVRTYEPDREIEWELTSADADWLGTRVGFVLEERGGTSWVRFRHTGWPEENEHYRVSCFCWAMYLRLLKRFVEVDERVEYERRLEV